MKWLFGVRLLLVTIILSIGSFVVRGQDITIPNDSVWGISWSPDSSKIAVGRYNGVVEVKNATSGQLLLTLQSGNSSQLITSVWSPDGTKIAASNEVNSVYIWDAVTGQLLRTILGQNSSKVSYLIWSPDSTKVAGTSLAINLLQVWNVSNGSMSFSVQGAGQGLDWYQNKIALGSGNGISVVDSANGNFIKDIGLHIGTIITVAWSPDGNKIASGSIDGEVKIWDANLNGSISSNQPLFTFSEHLLPVVTVDWSPDGTRVVSSSLDGTFKVWNATNGQLLQTIQNGVPALVSQFSPNGTKIAYGGASNSTQVVTAPAATAPTAVPSPTPISPGLGGKGLLGQYYDDSNLIDFKLNRIDPLIDFNWGYNSPHVTIGVDTFSIRWTGQLIPQYTQTYTFYTQSDDGVRLWINNQQIINNWTNHASVENTGTIALTSGVRYNIRMEYYENNNGTVARLSWSSSSQPKQVIPTDRLFPNGRIAFQSYRDGNDEIYLINGDGTNPVNFTNNSAADQFPTIATGTQNLVFASTRTGNSEIFTVPLSGGTPLNLTNHGSYDHYPSQGPDGRIVFASTRSAGGNFNLWIMNANGSGLTQLTNTTGAERYSSWSPDGQWIVYDVDESGVYDLWKIPSSGGTAIRLTQNASSNNYPAWSPDGANIVFHSTRDGGHGIYLMDSNGSNQRPFRIGGLNGFDPTWSPDGTLITYHAYPTNQPDIYSIPLGSTIRTQLTNNSAADQASSWGAQ